MAKKRKRYNNYNNSRKVAQEWLKSHDLITWLLIVPPVFMVLLLLSVAVKF